MASTGAMCSPSSLQLRLALNCRNCRKQSALFAWSWGQHRKLDCRFRVFCVAKNAVGNGNSAERRNDASLVMSDSKDGFSGWSATDGGEVSDPQKKWVGGLVGTGVAGLILVSGLTFAVFSISKQNSSRKKQQMEPLTTQQELLLVSDKENDTLTEDGKEDNITKEDNSNLEDEAGTYKDSSSIPECEEIPNENRLTDDDKLRGNDVINDDSIHEDLKYESELYDESYAPENSSQLNLSDSDVVSDSYVASDSNDLSRNPSVGTAELASDRENSINATLTNSTVSDANSLKLDTENQDNMPDPSSNQSSDSGGLTNEPVALGHSVNSNSNANSEPREFSQDDIESVASTTSERNVDLSNSEQVLGEVHKQEVDGYNVVNRTGSALQIPGNSFSCAGIPAPVVSAAPQAFPGKILVPAVVDQVQGHTLAALQVLKVIEADVQPGDLCTRREYARWLVSASSALSRNAISKVYPAMYIENVTELAFDDITPEDPDYASIQGLAEAGLLSSKLSRRDMFSSLDEEQGLLYFSPESSLSRQELVSWKMALQKRQLPEADREALHKVSGFIDVDNIHPDACPALVADLSAGESGIVALAFGYTRLFQPDKPVTKAQAAIALSTGEASDIVGEELTRIEAESIAENAVAEHSALVAQVEKDINASFEKELLLEREKIDAVEKMAEEARQELEKLRSEKEREKIDLMEKRAAVESEMVILSSLRGEVEEQLQSLMSNKVEISYEKERISKLRKEAEIENQEIARLQYELEVERKALSMARAWAEDEAKRARDQAKALEEARDRWERRGIKVIVDDDLREQTSDSVTWLDAGKQFSVEGTVSRAENLMDKLKIMAAEIGGKSRDIINMIIQKIASLISNLRQWGSGVSEQAEELKNISISKASRLGTELQRSTGELSLVVKDGARRIVGDCRDRVEKITQRFKT